MRLIFITNDPWKARVADNAGVHRVMVDLETLGKRERQAHRDTRISEHSVADVAAVRDELRVAQLVVRVNPVNPGSHEEIDAALQHGADVLMLPMARRHRDVTDFVDLVSGRARTCLLLETAAALARAKQLMAIEGLDEVHVGLNDLHAELGLQFMFEIVAGGLIDHLASVARRSGLPFGFGGVARIGAVSSAVPAESVLAEHVRVGSDQVILSRDFDRLLGVRNESAAKAFREEVGAILNYIDNLERRTPEERARSSKLFAEQVASVLRIQDQRSGR